MQRRRLGQLEVSAVGLGCGTITPFYGEPDLAAGRSQDAVHRNNRTSVSRMARSRKRSVSTMALPRSSSLAL
jgi:hypothetical protein